MKAFKKFIGISVFFVIITFSMLFITTMVAVYSEPRGGVDAVIILGCGLRGTEVSVTLRQRLDRALEYINENPGTVVVVSGGQGVDQVISEAEAMRRYLVRFGVPEQRIIMEDRSTNTKENLAFSRVLLDGYFEGEYNVVVVTSEFHILRALGYAGRAGLDALPLASRSTKSFLPGYYFREYFALMWYYVIEAWR